MHFQLTFVYSKVKLEAALANMSWKVRWEDIILDHGPRQSFMSKITTSSQVNIAIMFNCML